MTFTKLFSFLLAIFLIGSCNSNIASMKMKCCGYELTDNECLRLDLEIDPKNSAYAADTLDHFYSQINDSIRSTMPASVEFEIFLSLLNQNEIVVDVYVEKNEHYFEKIGCSFMNSKFSDKMPSQRVLRLYTYTNPDGSGNIPFAFAIKRQK